MTAIAATSAVAAASTPASGAEHALLKKTGQQFEALLMRQMLAEARKTHFDNDLFSSEGVNTFREMMDSRFADVASQSGTLGLGKMIEAQVTRLQGSAK